MTLQFYDVIDDDELAKVADEMKQVAQDNFIDDYDKFAQEAQEDESLRHEMHGDMIRSRGKHLPKAVEKYTRFFCVDGFTLQVGYMEMNTGDYKAKQLNIVENRKVHLNTDVVEKVMEHFLDMNGTVHIPKTPPHVIILLQKIGE